MRNRHGQMDQDLYVRDLENALSSAIRMVHKMWEDPGTSHHMVDEAREFLDRMERE